MILTDALTLVPMPIAPQPDPNSAMSTDPLEYVAAAAMPLLLACLEDETK